MMVIKRTILALLVLASVGYVGLSGSQTTKSGFSAKDGPWPCPRTVCPVNTGRALEQK